MINKIFRHLSFFILGALLGAGLTGMLIGDQVDYLTLANKNLQDQLAEKEYQLQKLNESSRQNMAHVITSVESYLSADSTKDLTEYDQLSLQLEASKKTKEWLSPLIGQDVSSLDNLLIPRIVDDRMIEAGGSRYRLKTHLIIINQKIELYLKASLIKTGATE